MALLALQCSVVIVQLLLLSIIQIAVIEGTFLAIEHMSERKGGHGGTVINVASFGGGLETSRYDPRQFYFPIHRTKLSALN